MTATLSQVAARPHGSIAALSHAPPTDPRRTRRGARRECGLAAAPHGARGPGILWYAWRMSARRRSLTLILLAATGCEATIAEPGVTDLAVTASVAVAPGATPPGTSVTV